MRQPENLVPIYFFHQHLNGRLLARDQNGTDLADEDAAVERAMHLISDLLSRQTSDNLTRSAGGSASNVGTNRTHLSVEICHGLETLSIVRGKVYVESPETVGKAAGGSKSRLS